MPLSEGRKSTIIPDRVQNPRGPSTSNERKANKLNYKKRSEAKEVPSSGCCSYASNISITDKATETWLDREARGVFCSTNVKNRLIAERYMLVLTKRLMIPGFKPSLAGYLVTFFSF